MTQPKPYESRHRLTWAAHYPLLPGRDLTTRQAILLQIADTAISGQYYEPQARLAERVGMSVRGVQKALAKLCAEGALRAHRRGFKKTTRYTLMRLDEVAKHGDFLPVETNPSSPQTTNPPPFETNPSSPRIAFETNPSSYKEDIKHEEKKTPPTPPLKQEPKNEPGTISPTARRLNDFIVKRTSRTLPASWQSYAHLTQQVEPLNFQALASVLAATAERMGGRLPEPQDFFESYDENQEPESTKPRKRKPRDRKKKKKEKLKAA